MKAKEPPPKGSPKGVATSKDKSKAEQDGEVEEVEEVDWRDYDDGTGMPLPNGPLEPDQITRIFGDDVLSTNDGNYILMVLQHRRVSGSLVERGLTFPDVGFPREVYEKGLEHLRNTYPVDEEEAAKDFLEEEAKRLEEEGLVHRAYTVGLYKSEDPDNKDFQGTNYGQRYSRSWLVERQKEIQADKARKEEEEEQKEAEIVATGGLAKAQNTSMSVWKQVKQTHMTREYHSLEAP